MGKSYQVAMHLGSYGIRVTEPGRADRWMPIKFAALAEAEAAIRLLLAREVALMLAHEEAAGADPVACVMGRHAKLVGHHANRPRQEAEAAVTEV